MRAGGAAVVVGVGCVVAQLDSSQIEPTAAVRAKTRVVCMTDSLVISAQSYSVFSNCDTHSPWRGNLIVRGHNFGTGRSQGDAVGVQSSAPRATFDSIRYERDQSAVMYRRLAQGS